MDLDTALAIAMERLRSKADPKSTEYDPNYEALVYMLASNYNADIIGANGTKETIRTDALEHIMSST